MYVVEIPVPSPIMFRIQDERLQLSISFPFNMIIDSSQSEDYAGAFLPRNFCDQDKRVDFLLMYDWDPGVPFIVYFLQET